MIGNALPPPFIKSHALQVAYWLNDEGDDDFVFERNRI
jgi:hypothetical protein